MDQLEKIVFGTLGLLIFAFVFANGIFLVSSIYPKIKDLEKLTLIQAQNLDTNKKITTMNDHLENIYFDMAGTHGKIAGMEQSLARIETQLIGE